MHETNDVDASQVDRLKFDWWSGRERLWFYSGCLSIVMGLPLVIILSAPAYTESRMAVAIIFAMACFWQCVHTDDHYEIHFSERCVNRVKSNSKGESRKLLWRFEDLEAVALCAGRNPNRGSNRRSGALHVFGLQLVTRKGRIWPLSPPHSQDRQKQDELGAIVAERMGLRYENSHPERRLMVKRRWAGRLELSRETPTASFVREAARFLAFLLLAVAAFLGWMYHKTGGVAFW